MAGRRKANLLPKRGKGISPLFPHSIKLAAAPQICPSSSPSVLEENFLREKSFTLGERFLSIGMMSHQPCWRSLSKKKKKGKSLSRKKCNDLRKLHYFTDHMVWHF